MPPTKKRRFTAQNLIVTREFENSNSSDLVVTIRRWGCTLNVFPNGTTGESLWQLQIRHNPAQRMNGFGSQLLATVRDALQSYPTPEIRDLKTLEDQEQILIYNGGPGRNGEHDPDKVGLEPWQAVIYQGGEDPNKALDFIHFIMKHKIRKGQIIQMPKLLVVSREEALPADLPDAWELSSQAAPHKPFAAVPPKQRRHILCQLEIKECPEQNDQAVPDEQTIPDSEAEEDSDYIFSLFGGMYNYRDLLDAANINGGYVEIDENGTREYVRMLQIKNDRDGRAQIQSLLEDVLCKLPLYFINATEKANDPLARWIKEQPSIVPSEQSK